jgi:putative FmdB family regulatory protein
MPIFEYICKDCKKKFETLVYGPKKPSCPLCQGSSLDQQISVFSVRSAKPVSACAAAAGCGSSCPAGSNGSSAGCPFD